MEKPSHLKRGWIVFSLLSFVGLALFAFVRCSLSGETEGPFTSAEALARLKQLDHHLPVYIVTPDTTYHNLDLQFYYFNNSSELGLVSYFPNDTDQKIVAKLDVRNLSVGFDGAMNNSKVVSVRWDDNGEARTCDPVPNLTAMSKSPHEPYVSCLVWQVDNLNYLFLSSFDLKDTLELVNSLELAE